MPKPDGMHLGYGSKHGSLLKRRMKVKTMTTYTDPAPWTQAPDSLWRNNDLDPHRFALREQLQREEVKDFKIAEAIETGRIYGLGSQHYEMIRQKKLEAVLAKRPVTSKLW